MLDQMGTKLIMPMWLMAVIRGEFDIKEILPDRLKGVDV